MKFWSDIILVTLFTTEFAYLVDSYSSISTSKFTLGLFTLVITTLGITLSAINHIIKFANRSLSKEGDE